MSNSATVCRKCRERCDSKGGFSENKDFRDEDAEEPEGEEGWLGDKDFRCSIIETPGDVCVWVKKVGDAWQAVNGTLPGRTSDTAATGPGSLLFLALLCFASLRRAAATHFILKYVVHAAHSCAALQRD